MRQLVAVMVLTAALVPGCRKSSSDDAVAPPGPGSLLTSATSPGATGDQIAKAMAIDTTAMYVVGVGGPVGDGHWRIEKRLLADLSLVAAFGTAGVATSDPTVGTDEPTAIAIDATSMYVTGFTSAGGWRIEKRSLATGALVGGFGSGGSIGYIDPNNAAPVSIALTATHMIVAGAVKMGGATGGGFWRIEKRALSNGLQDSAFAGTGILDVDPTANDDAPASVALDATHLYVGGYVATTPSNERWYLEKRALADGALDAGFGLGGTLSLDQTGTGDRITAVRVASGSLYLGGSIDISGGSTNKRWLIEKRSAATGGIDASFGTGGQVTIDPSPSAQPEELTDLAIDGTSMFVVGTESPTGTGTVRYEQRSSVNGAMMTGWGTGGIVVSDAGPGVERMAALAVDTAGVYAAGLADVTGMGREWRIEKRSR